MSLSDLLKKPNATPVYLLEITAGDYLRKWVAYAPLPDVVTGVAGVRGGAKESVLTWSAAANATGYKIYRGTVSGSLSLVTTVGAVLTYTDTAPANNTLYYYAIVATNATGDSAASSEVSVKTWLAYDAFARADTTTPDTMESGQSWTTWVLLAQILNEQLCSQALGMATWAADLGTATAGAVAVSAVTITPAVGSFLDVLGRGTDVNNYNIIQFGNTPTMQALAFKRVGGTYTQIGSCSLTINAGGELSLGFIGNLWTIQRNGTTILSTTDSANSTGTIWGAGSGDPAYPVETFKVYT